MTTNAMLLFHATTPRKAKRYRETGYIKAPVRGFTTFKAAMAWAVKTHRTVILKFSASAPHKLPDHHNRFGEAWWNDADVFCDDYTCVFNADSDA